ncbi:MAG: NYN domain-containing protein [Eubacteriales bacterium]|nr:NYN domain-containing protein [Eubacteriales bacterium]
MAKFAVFVDLENCGAKVETLRNIINKIKLKGNILIGKVYGYTENFSSLKELLLSNTFTVVPSIRYGISQKNNADIQLVVDALEVAYTNPLIDSYCIVSGDSDYMPLVGKLKAMGKFVIGMSRSEAASNIFINACNEFHFLEYVSTPPKNQQNNSQKKKQINGDNDIISDEELNKNIIEIIEQSDDGEVYASELKGIILRLRPDFNEKNYGCSTFGKLLTKLENKFNQIKVLNDKLTVIVTLNSKYSVSEENTEKIGPDNWNKIFKAKLSNYKESGFDRINPSILKAQLLSEYPDFNERVIGFKRFSDVMKQLEKDGLIKIIMDTNGTMLIELK